MQSDFLLLSEPANGIVPCAIRIQAPKDVDRTSSHLVLLLDISTSMLEQEKLENVKRCCHLILDLLTADDHLSLITFGDTSDILLNRVTVDSAKKEHIRSVISHLSVDGCTNLSAGILNVKNVLKKDEKAGVLLLTDGMANRGIVDAAKLQEIVQSVCTDSVGIHCVGYGINHNAELLRSLAEQNHGSYNIVNSIEDTAFAFGDTLGGLMSCFAQNVTVTLPPEAVVHGPCVVKHGKVVMGDVNAGTQPILLFDIPVAALATVSIQGTIVKDLVDFRQEAVWLSLIERNQDIELCRLRYTCSDIMKDLREWSSLSLSLRGAIKTRIDEFETKLQDSFLAGHSLTLMLTEEVNMLRDMLRSLQTHHVTQEQQTILSQHSAVVGLARGFSTPYRNVSEDPQNIRSTTFQNPTQQRIATNLRTASGVPY
jgi:hypothetical protein